MKCYIVTESEVKKIGVANLGFTVFVGLGGAFMGVWAGAVLTAQPLLSVFQPLALGLAIVCWLIAGALWFWRWDMLKLIKRESYGSMVNSALRK